MTEKYPNQVSEHYTSAAILWSAGGQVVTQIVTLVTSILLARFLLPEDFGIFGAATIFTALLGIMVNLGVQELVLRETELRPAFLSTMLALNLSAGGLLALGAIIGAALLAELVNSATAAIVLRVLPLSIVFVASAGLPRALLVRRMEQRLIARAEVLAMFGYALVTASLAILGAGFWALVAGTLTSALVSSIILWYSAGAWISPSFSLDETKHVLSLGTKVAAGSTLVWASGLVDRFLVSRFLGVTSLGYYVFAINLAWLPVRKVTAVLNSVVQARLADEYRGSEDVYGQYLRITTFTTTVMWLPLSMILVSANELIGVVYGTKWLPTVTPVRILLISAAVSNLSTNCYSLYALYGRPSLTSYFSIGRICLTLIMIVLLLDYGIAGAALGCLIASCANLILNQWFTARLLGGNFRSFFDALKQAVTMAIGAIAIGLIARYFLFSALSPPVLLVVILSLVASAYLSILAIGFRKLWRDLAQYLRSGIGEVIGPEHGLNQLKLATMGIFLQKH